MKIKKLILKNFRAYKDITIDFDSDLNVIIGRNDVGKSTILEALDIFFEGGAVKIDISDCNVFSSKKEITIGVMLEVEKNRKYLLDEQVKTTLEEESLLNQAGFLEIHRVWDYSKKSIKKASLSTFFNSYYFKEFKDKPLINLKNQDLKKILSNRNLKCSNQSINSEIRKSIYKNLDNLSKENKLIQLDKEDAKRTWESIETELPMVFLFQSDRANKDSDKEVQDPLRVITKQVISTVEGELKKVETEIKNNIQKLGRLTIEKLKQLTPEISDTLEPNIKNKPWDSLFNFSFNDEKHIPINKRGSGVRRLILLSYFQVQADQKSTDNKNIIYAIEEPETSQHPNYQKMLIKSLQEISKKSKSQVFITTHTPEIAKLCNKEDLILLKKEGEEVSIDTSDDKMKEIANTLGLLPYLSKFCIFVEGKNDIIFLETINKNIQELKNIIDLQKSKVPILPAFGGNLKNWVNRAYVWESNIKAFHLYDRDQQDEVKKINDRNDKNKAQTTKFREMENYFSPSLVEKHFGIKFLKAEKQKWKEEDIVKLIITHKKNMFEKDIKNKMNKELVKKISKETLEDIGARDEVEGWFKTMKEMYDEG